MVKVCRLGIGTYVVVVAVSVGLAPAATAESPRGTSSAHPIGPSATPDATGTTVVGFGRIYRYRGHEGAPQRVEARAQDATEPLARRRAIDRWQRQVLEVYGPVYARWFLSEDRQVSCTAQASRPRPLSDRAASPAPPKAHAATPRVTCTVSAMPIRPEGTRMGVTR